MAPVGASPASEGEPGFCIDRWEAHLVDVTDGVPAPHAYYLRPVEGRRYAARSGPDVYPQSYVSRHEAAAACEVAGKRLCRWIEWRRACQGPKWFRYPYGNGGKNRTCNTGKDHLMTMFFGADPKAWDTDAFNDPKLVQKPGFLAKTGAFEGCVSPDGLFDMYGNVHEWVVDPVTTSFMKKLEGEGVERQKQPWRSGNGMFLGGFFSTLAEHGPGCHFTTAAHGPGYHDYSTGFRCCADPRDSRSASHKDL